MSYDINYSISTDTLNGIVNESKLHNEILNSSIDSVLIGINTDGDNLTVSFVTTLSSEDETTLDALLSSHDGQKTETKPLSVKPSPFAEKGQLFFRGQGVKQNCLANSTTNITFVVPYTKAKLNGIEILYGQDRDLCQFKVLDSTTGTYTGVANYLLNQFGYDWNVDSNAMKEILPYDADVFYGMQLVVEYTNNGNSDVEVGVNFYLHEDKS